MNVSVASRRVSVSLRCECSTAATRLDDRSMSFCNTEHVCIFCHYQDELMEEDGLLVLGLHNLDAAAKRFVLMMVMFYTPGCEGFAELELEYLKASDELYEFYIPLAKVRFGC